MKNKIYIHGKSGRMGTILLSLIKNDDYFSISSFNKCDIVIDFSSENGLLSILNRCVKNKIPLITGTTGLSQETLDKLQNARGYISIIHKNNFSNDIDFLKNILSNPYLINKRITIEETHHKDKKDSPSGTAIDLAKTIKEYTNSLPIIKSIRNNDIIGKHKIIIKSDNEKLEFIHTALSREAFAIGALNCAKTILNFKNEKQ